MTFTEIFESYYNLYRLEAETPGTADDEYPVAIRLANEAVNRWANYDGTYWKELFSTLQTGDGGGDTVITSATTYAAPDDMQEAGGYVRVWSATGTRVHRYPILNNNEVQFRNELGTYCWFTGNRNAGFTLHLNPSPTTNLIGLRMEYDYYKKPNKFTAANANSQVADMSDPYFIVHRMLANRFRGSRNPYYGSAKADAEDILKTMQADNNSGSWANPWSLQDNSGTTWGE